MKHGSASNIIKLLASIIVLISVFITGLTGCSEETGFTGLPSLMKLVPAGYDQVQYINVNNLRNDKDYTRYYLSFTERFRPLTEDMGVPAEDVQHFGMAIDERLKVFYLRGSFSPETINDTFEANGFRKEDYRCYELWSGPEYTVVVHGNLIIFSDLANAVKDSLDTMDAPETSLYTYGFKDIAAMAPDDLYAIAATGEEAHYDGAISITMGLAKVDDITAGVTYRVHCENESSGKAIIAQIESTIGSVLFVKNFSIEQSGNDVNCRFEAPNETLFEFDF